MHARAANPDAPRSAANAPRTSAAEATPSPQPSDMLAAQEADDADEAPASIEQLLAALPNVRDVKRTLEFAAELGETRDERALAALFAWCESSELSVVSAAFAAIARVGGERSLAFLEQELWQARGETRGFVSEALAVFDSPESRALLRRAARSERSGLRDVALAALASSDSDDTRDFMLSELTSFDPSAAVEYFTDAIDERAVPVLASIVQRANSELSARAALALVAQGRAAEPVLLALLADDDDSADAVFAAIQDELSLKPALRAAAIRRLSDGELDPGPVLEFLTHDLSSAASAALLAAAHERDGAESALTALGSRGDSASRAALSLLARDADPKVAAAAQCQLLQTPDARSLDTLLAPAEAGLEVARVAALLGIAADAGVRELGRLERSVNSAERAAAARLLARFGPTGAERELERLAADEDLTVASASLNSLAALHADAALSALAERADLPEHTRARARWLAARLASSS